MRRIVVLGAGGRDFHDHAMALRDDPTVEVVAFTAAQIPGIDDRLFPASLAGPRYPNGIPIRPESELTQIIDECGVDEVVLSYSDLSHVEVMHKASIALAAGAGFRLLSPDITMLRSHRRVIAVGATRTGCGKSQTSRAVASLVKRMGLRVVLVRHPMPYGDLEAARVQRFARIEDIDAAHPTVEEREEYEVPVRMGLVVYAGVDYSEVLRRAETEADVIVWDGGNNDLPFIRPDLMITVCDPLRPNDTLAYHPGEANVRRADVIVVNKVDSASPEQIAKVERAVRSVNEQAPIVRTASPVTLGAGPSLHGARVLVVEDGPSLTHGGLSFGAGTVAARQAGAASLVDPRPFAVGSIARTLERFHHLATVLPAMGYGAEQLADLADTIRKTDCDVVVTGTPIDLARLIDIGHPHRHASYELRETGSPTLVEVLLPHVLRWGGKAPNP